jgi:hypothetical protein
MKRVNLPAALTDWFDELGDEMVVGMPTMVMFPAGNYCFRVTEDKHKITIPSKGVFKDLAPGVFTDEKDKFKIYDEENEVFYLATLTKVLFAVSKYPDLSDDQFFAPMVLLFNEDTIDIVGKVIEVVPPELIPDDKKKGYIS